MQRPPPKPPFNFQKNKVFILGGAFIILLLLTIVFAFSGEDGSDTNATESTGFLLFGGIDPQLLTNCEGDLNGCDNTLEIRDAQLASANKTVSKKSDEINTLKSEKVDINALFTACISEKETYLLAFNTTEQKFIDCNHTLTDLDLNLNTCQNNFSICDANLSTNITNWLANRSAFQTCNDERSSLEEEIEDLESDIVDLDEVVLHYQNLYNNCSGFLTDCQNQLEDLNASLISTANYLCDYNSSFCCDTNSWMWC